MVKIADQGKARPGLRRSQSWTTWWGAISRWPPKSIEDRWMVNLGTIFQGTAGMKSFLKGVSTGRVCYDGATGSGS